MPKNPIGFLRNAIIAKTVICKLKKVNIETAKYISNCYPQFFNEKENIAHRHLNSIFKLDGESENSSRYKVYKRTGRITSDKKALELVKNGETEFFINTANRILKEHKAEIYLNKCLNCGKLAKTPLARMCRYCDEKWFDSSNTFGQVDYVLNKWIPKYGLTIGTKYKDEKVRSISVVDDNGNSYQIWIEPIKLNQIKVNASYPQNIKTESWKTQTDLNDFENILNEAYSEIEKWITEKGNTRSYVQKPADNNTYN